MTPTQKLAEAPLCSAGMPYAKWRIAMQAMGSADEIYNDKTAADCVRWTQHATPKRCFTATGPHGQTGAGFAFYLIRPLRDRLLTQKPESTANPNRQNPFRETTGAQERGPLGERSWRGTRRVWERRLGRASGARGRRSGSFQGASLGEQGGGVIGWVGRALRWSQAGVE